MAREVKKISNSYTCPAGRVAKVILHAAATTGGGAGLQAGTGFQIFLGSQASSWGYETPGGSNNPHPGDGQVLGLSAGVPTVFTNTFYLGAGESISGGAAFYGVAIEEF